MSAIIIDSFSFNNELGNNNTYQIYFDPETEAFSVVFTGDGSELGVVSLTQRSRLNGALIGSVVNDDVTIRYYLSSTNVTPFAYISSQEEIVPEPPACDLSLSIVATNETSPSANDGTATLNATSSFEPIEYSIDGTSFGSDHVFTGLAPGNYTGYTRDENGCINNKPFTIVQFSNPVDEGFSRGLPEVTVSAGNISRWNAAYNPIVLNFSNTLDPSKKNFRIEIEITSQNGVVIGSWSPDPQGKTRCDISAYLQSLVNANDDFKYDAFNWRDYNRSASYTIRYREVWDSDTSAWFYAPQPLYVTYSAKQLGDKYGGNMAQYVPFLAEPNPDYKAKFLTLFKEPTFWVGLPYDNSFIFSEYIITESVKVRTTSLDINRQPFGGETFSFLLNNDAGYILGSDLGRLIIQKSPLPVVSNDGILDQLGINRLMLSGNPALGVEYFKIQLYTGSDEAPNYITQPLIINTLRQCNDPYIYLKWLNTLGGWDYWRFGQDQIITLSTSDDITIDRNVFDWENEDTIADIIKKSAAEKISFGCTVPEIKVDGLKGLHNSVKIQMLTDINPYKWQTVIIGTGSFDIKHTKNKMAELKFQITLPEINIQRQ